MINFMLGFTMGFIIGLGINKAKRVTIRMTAEEAIKVIESNEQVDKLKKELHL